MLGSPVGAASDAEDEEMASVARMIEPLVGIFIVEEFLEGWYLSQGLPGFANKV